MQALKLYSFGFLYQRIIECETSCMNVSFVADYQEVGNTVMFCLVLGPYVDVDT
jgi:hypothetical protein